MRAVSIYGTFAEALVGSSPEAQRLTWALRALIEDVYPNATEVPWPKTR